MPKLIKNKYYNSKGQEGITSYTISISKSVAKKAEFDENTKLVVTAEKGKIIIKQETDN